MQRGGCRHDMTKKGKYYIPKNRQYELIYFCLQYPEWKKYLKDYELRKGTREFDDPTGEEAVKRCLCYEKVKLIEKIAHLAGGDIFETYILKAVTEDLSYNNLRTFYNMPISRDLYYEMWHKFFYFLSQEKHSF